MQTIQNLYNDNRCFTLGLDRPFKACHNYITSKTDSKVIHFIVGLIPYIITGPLLALAMLIKAPQYALDSKGRQEALNAQLADMTGMTLERCQALIRQGAHLPEERAHDVLGKALRAGMLDVFKGLADKCNVDFSKSSQVIYIIDNHLHRGHARYGACPVSEAVEITPELVRMFIEEYGAPVYVHNRQAGRTPLSFLEEAVRASQEKLRELKDNPNVSSTQIEAVNGWIESWKPLYDLIKAKHKAEFKEILEGRLELPEANPGTEPELEVGSKLLYRAVCSAAAKTQVEMLLDLGVDVNSVIYPDKNVKALHAVGFRLELATLLIDRGAEVNALDYHGNTPLMRILKKAENPAHPAQQERYMAMAQLFVDRGADLTAVNNADQTAADLAKASGLTEIAELLSTNNKEESA